MRSACAYKRGGGSFGPKSHPPPQKKLTHFLAWEKSNLPRLPLVRPPQTLPIRNNSLQAQPGRDVA